MTTGEWLESLSSADEGSTMLTIVAELEGTYPVLAPVESFEVNLVDENFDANLDILTLSADLIVDEFTVDATTNTYTADIIMENYYGN